MDESLPVQSNSRPSVYETDALPVALPPLSLMAGPELQRHDLILSMGINIISKCFMDEKDVQEKVKKRMKDGWIKSSMFIEVLAVSEKASRDALDNLLEKMGREDKTFIYKKSFKETKKVDNPLPEVPVGYSSLLEIELLTENYEKLVYLAMNYGPSSIEILEPEKIKLDHWEAQGIVNSIADIIHKFAAMGIGGVVVKT